MLIANRKCQVQSHIHTSYETVVQNDKTDKNIVKASQGQEEPVERVLHLLAGQGDGGEGVSNHPE